MTIILLAFFAQTLHFQSQNQLPQWSGKHLAEPVPPTLQGEDVLVLFDEVEVRAAEDGKIRVIHRSLRKVLSELGVDRASVFYCFNQLGGTQVERLDGWHQFANGNLEVLGTGQVVTIGARSSDAVHDGQVTIGYFRKVARGSVIAFESEEIVDLYLGPILPFPILGDMPIVRKVIRVDQPDLIQLQPMNLAAWSLRPQRSENSLQFKALPSEEAHDWTPRSRAYSPVVFARMKHPRTDSYRNWNELARWYNRIFTAAALPKRAKAGKPLTEPESFYQVADVTKRKLAYRQVYLSPHRGWVPDAGIDVLKRSFGDCKDMVSCSVYLLAEENVSALPALANIYDGFDFKAEDPANPWFNHVIVAIPLSRSLDLAAEVVVAEKLFLLFDPTAQDTPAGLLPRAFFGRHVLICTAEAGHWVKVPDSALEPARTDFSLTGSLDVSLTYRGEFAVHELGDAIGLRGSLSSSTRRNREEWFRSAFRLPVDATVELTGFESDGRGAVTMRCRVVWPQFLRPSPLGWRLPPSIVQQPLAFYGESEPNRQAPLAIPAWPLESWTIALESVRQLKPLKAQFDWSNQRHRIHWQANTDKGFNLQFETQGTRDVFTGNNLGAGLNHLVELQQNYERFALFTPVFVE